MIDRRIALRALAVAPLAAGVLGRTSAWAATAGSWKQAFDEALIDDPRLLGWQGVTEKRLETANLALTGTLPPDLVGTLYRNGPGRHERGGHRYRHWFDGDGMVQAFRFDGGGVHHLGRMVETAKFVAEEEAGRHRLPAFGTAAPEHGSAEPIALRGADDLNPANISVLDHGGELLALWEGGSAHRLDATTLATRGRKSWHPDLEGAAFSAHPKVEPDGTLWNFGYALDRGLLVLYHIGAGGGLRDAGVVPVDNLGMVHDFVVTARHLVFVLAPLVYEPARFGPSSSFLDAHVWRPQLGTRVLVVAKDDFSRRRWYQLPAGFSFHFSNAWEDETGRIRFDYCVAPDASVMTETLRYVMRGEFRPPTAPTRLAQVVLSPNGRVTHDISNLSAEFPRVAPAVVARRHRQVYVLAGGSGISGAGLGAIARYDTEAGLADSFDYGERFIPEEHVFVPRPGAAGEIDGWLVGTALDLDAKITRVSVFDAAHLGDGPVASAALPYPLPLGFHGIFVAA